LGRTHSRNRRQPSRKILSLHRIAPSIRSSLTKSTANAIRAKFPLHPFLSGSGDPIEARALSNANAPPMTNGRLRPVVLTARMYRAQTSLRAPHARAWNTIRATTMTRPTRYSRSPTTSAAPREACHDDRADGADERLACARRQMGVRENSRQIDRDRHDDKTSVARAASSAEKRWPFGRERHRRNSRPERFCYRMFPVWPSE
jgi:hypothetical protein